MITDSQLEALKVGGKDASLEWSLFSAGAALGLLPVLAQTVLKIYADEMPFILEYILSAVAIGLAVMAWTRWKEYGRKKTSIDMLVQKILSGQKINVGS